MVQLLARRHAGKEVPDSQCAGKAPPPTLACEVACPGDCVVGPWSSWSPCSQACGPAHPDGQQSRSRSLLALPGKGGRACPGAQALEEWRPCADHPCNAVYWDAWPWGPCVEDATATSTTTATTNPTANPANGTDGFRMGTPDCPAGVQIRTVDCVAAGLPGKLMSQRSGHAAAAAAALATPRRYGCQTAAAAAAAAAFDSANEESGLDWFQLSPDFI
ncbi:hypothetical protein CRUP_007473 [Coryphaenoides rupestris]|nr:hypothetical protein CRUP_007473 [Coryphaenoides rupestris]